MGNKLNMPKAPKQFGSWLNLYKSANLCEKTKRIYYLEKSFDNFSNKVEQKDITVSLLCQYVAHECSETIDKIIKLNEELTAENARLLMDLEQLKNRKI